jgi:uncharacterized membrane protein YjfL (UPF0719 family)
MTLQTLALIDLSALGGPLLAMVVFAIVGILLMVLGFKVFDWITPHIDIQKELAEKNNIAVGIVIGSVIIGVALVVAAAMS